MKEAENEFDRRLVEIRTAGEATLGKIRAATELALKVAREGAEREREASLETARGAAETEAEAILAQARANAEVAVGSFGRGATARRFQLLAVLLEGILDRAPDDPE